MKAARARAARLQQQGVGGHLDRALMKDRPRTGSESEVAYALADVVDQPR